METIKRLQDWCHSNCDTAWEHDFGVEIGTLDNPGWRIKIDLEGTSKENSSFKKNKIERTEDDWLHCWVEDNVFHGACGPFNLEETLQIFLKWANPSSGKSRNSKKK